MVDVFAVLVLAGVIGAVLIRKVQRPVRFKGSHLGEADLILGLIAGIVTTLLLWHATQIALGLNEWPAGWSPTADALSGLFGDGSADRGARARLRLGPCADHPRLPRLPASLQAPPHPHRGGQRVLRAHRPGWATAAAALRRPRGGDAVRGGDRSRPHWKQTVDTSPAPSAGAVQDVCPAFATGKELSPKLLIMAAPRPGVRRGAEAAAAARRASSHSHWSRRRQRRRRLGLRHLRRLRARVPGLDRARGPHHRSAPPSGDGRLALPRRGRADAARRRARLEPLGQAADRARRLGGAARRPRARAR